MTSKADSTNPYLNSRNEWNERYGSYIARAHNMTLIAVCSLVIAAISVSGLVYIGSQSKMIPYIVETKDGLPIGISHPSQSSARDPRITQAMIASWITNIRGVSSDPVVQKKSLANVYSLLQNGSSAKTFIDNYYKNGGNPYERASKETVSVEIKSILSISPSTWQVEWTEEIRNLSGEMTGTLRMKGAVSVKFIKPSPTLIYQNPLGLISDKISWSRRL